MRVYDGGFFIKYLDPNLNGNFGMNCHYKNFGHSASAMKKEIIIMAGEWLERSGLKRGRNNEDEIVGVDGLPLKYQPKKEPLELKPVDLPPDVHAKLVEHRIANEHGDTLQ